MGDGVLNLVSSVQQIALEHPEKIAYHFMGKDTTYGEFEQSSRAICNCIRSTWC